MADTLLGLIQEYRKQMAIYNAADCDVVEEDALAEATFMPFYHRLRTNPPAATSLEEAVEAIRLVADEEEFCGSQPALTIKVSRAALTFLEKVAAREVQP